MNFCVIGIGRFGYHVATKLAEHGMEVLAVDSNESMINSIRDKVTHAVCMRVKDEESLRNIGVEEIDTVIVAMGENFSQSILITALLKQKLKVKNVIARSISMVHKDILNLIGADHVVLPEQEMGVRLADKLSLTFSSYVRITPIFSISHLIVPHKFVGKTIAELNVQKSYGIICLGKKEGDAIAYLDDDYTIQEGDTLILAGPNKKLEKIARL